MQSTGISALCFSFIFILMTTISIHDSIDDFSLLSSIPTGVSVITAVVLAVLNVDNIYVEFGGQIFQQTIGIPMGTNSASLLADLFLYSYEADFMQELLRKGKQDLASKFKRLSVVTKPTKDTRVICSIFLIVAAMWTSIGLSYIWIDILPSIQIRNTTTSYDSKEVLLPGYAGFSIVYLILTTFLLFTKYNRQTAVFTSLLLILCVYEIVNFWVELQSQNALYICLALYTTFIFLTEVINTFKAEQKEYVSEKGKIISEFDDCGLVRNALNMIAFFPWVIRSTQTTHSSIYSFIWPFSSGIHLLVISLFGLRRDNDKISRHSLLDGLFWTALSGCIIIDVIKDYSDVILTSSATAVFVVFILTFLLSLPIDIVVAMQYMSLAIFCLALNTSGYDSIFTYILSWICCLLHLYGMVAVVVNTLLPLSFTIPTGKEVVEFERITDRLSRLFISRKNTVFPNEKKINKLEPINSTSMMGYTKYQNTESIGFASNIMAVISFVMVPNGLHYLSFSWGVIFGGLVPLMVGFMSFSRGETFESCSFLVFASFWSIWGSLRSLDLIEGNEGMTIALGLSSFLLVGLVLLCLSTTVNRLWFTLHVFFYLFVLNSFFTTLGAYDSDIFEVVVAIAFSLILIYAFISSSLQNILGKLLLPVGKPLVQISHLHTDKENAFWANSRRATGVKAIAEIMKNGAICGIPSDTVYVLVACCNKPEAVERAYKTKAFAEDRPMSMWISKIDQLRTAREEFGELLWSFLHEIWPSNISAVIKKGDWIKSLGLQDSEKYVGKPDSVAIRIPNSTIVCHLLDQCGPVAVTSANPTGEADTTHHLQVLAKLSLKNCDGILCDGPSMENAASTVVDCRNIESGTISFFRIGLTPKSKVLEIFEKVLKQSQGGRATKSKNGINDMQDKNGTISENRAINKNGSINNGFVVEEL